MCGIGVTSRMDVIWKPTACSARSAAMTSFECGGGARSGSSPDMPARDARPLREMPFDAMDSIAPRGIAVAFHVGARPGAVRADAGEVGLLRACVEMDRHAIPCGRKPQGLRDELQALEQRLQSAGAGASR